MEPLPCEECQGSCFVHEMFFGKRVLTEQKWGDNIIPTKPIGNIG